MRTTADLEVTSELDRLVTFHILGVMSLVVLWPSFKLATQLHIRDFFLWIVLRIYSMALYLGAGAFSF